MKIYPLILFGLLALAGCATKERNIIACPAVLIYDKAKEIYRYNDKGTDVADMLYHIELAYNATTCRAASGEVETKIPLVARIELGKSFKESIEVPVIVALVDKGDNLVAKTRENILLERIGLRDNFYFQKLIPVSFKFDRDNQPRDFKILFALDLNEVELKNIEKGGANIRPTWLK